MNDAQATMDNIGEKSKSRELTLAETDTFSGAQIIQAPAPQIGLFVAEVFTPAQLLRIR